MNGFITGKPCDHEGASIKSIDILNPDYIEVTPGFAGIEPSYYYTPDEMLIKAELALKIIKAIKTLKLTQLEASEVMGISQDKVSNILRGNFSRVSEKKLMDCLINLGYDIEISIKPSNTSVGHLMIA